MKNGIQEAAILPLTGHVCACLAVCESDRLLPPRGFLFLKAHVSSVRSLGYPIAVEVYAFDRESHGALRSEQKQFPELSYEWKHGNQTQDEQCQTARQFNNKRDSRPERTNAKF